MGPTWNEQIDHAYSLLRDYGPATALDYMQQAGGLDHFPASLIHTVATHLALRPQAGLPSASPLSSWSSEPSEVDVVVIEDDPALQAVISAVLRNEQIRVASTLGWKAQRFIQETDPKVVILDIKMPGIDGLQLFSLLRADPQTRTIPVIFLTGYPEKLQQEVPNYEQLHAVLVPKPFAIEQLIAVVKTALGS